MNCEFCSSCMTPLYEVELGNDKRQMWRCANCKSCQIDPVFSKEELDAFYKDTYFSRQPWELNKASLLAEDYLAKCLNYGFKAHSSIRVLEVGAGYGFFSALLAKNYSICVDVVEPSKDCRIYIQENFPNVRLVGEDLSAMESDTSYDYVFCFHTVEHLQRMGQFLGDLKAKLHHSGQLWIITPNGASSSFSKLGAKWGWACPNQHYQFLSTKIPRTYYKAFDFEIKKVIDLSPATIHFPSVLNGKIGGLIFYSKKLLPRLLSKPIAWLLSILQSLFIQNKAATNLLPVEKKLMSLMPWRIKDELLLQLEKTEPCELQR